MSNVIQLCAVERYISISKLKFHPNNPRSIRADRLEALKQSIIEKGFYQPILVWSKKNIVLAGNHRLLAAQELLSEGWEFESPRGERGVLPVVIENVTDSVANQILFETNNTYAEWVEDKLKKALESAEKSGEKLGSYGFTDEEVDKMLLSAVSDAEKITKSIKDDIDEMTDEEIEGKAKPLPEEEFESLMLEKSAYNLLKALLGDISETLDPEWHEAVGYSQAALALVKLADEKHLVEILRKQIEVEALNELDLTEVGSERGETMAKATKKVTAKAKNVKKAKTSKVKTVKKAKTSK